MLPAILLLLGCPQPCVGASCGANYTTGRLSVFFGAGLDSTPDLGAPDASLIGAAPLGNDWALEGDGDGVYVGLPAVYQARRLALGDFDDPELAEIPQDPSEPAATVYGVSAGTGFGAALDAWTGEAGERALVVGAPLTSAGTAGSGLGEAWLWSGLTAPPSGSLFTTTATGQLRGAEPQAHLGSAVAACGDLDGDGVGDAAVASEWADGGGTLRGEVRVYTSASSPFSAPTLLTWEGEGVGLGSALWCAGPLDDDKLAELVVGVAGGQTEQELATGLVVIWEGGDLEAPALTLRGTNGADELGRSIAVGDFDGDGRADLAVGAPGGDAAGVGDVAGAVHVWYGRRVPLDGGFRDRFDQAGADVVLQGTDGHGLLGTTVLAADLDGDGIDDLVAGAPGVNPSGETDAVQTGAVYAWYGAAERWAGGDVDGADVQVRGRHQFHRAGEALAAADLDGDGAADLVALTREE